MKALANNEGLKSVLRQYNIPLWRVAHELGIGENTLYRWLRYELTQEKKDKIDIAIRGILNDGRN